LMIGVPPIVSRMLSCRDMAGLGRATGNVLT